MEGNGNVAAKEHHDDDASGPQSDDLIIQDEHGHSPSLRQSGDDMASPRSASARERKDGSAAGIGGFRAGGRRLFDIIQQVQFPNRANADEDGNSGNSRWRSIRDRFRRAGAAMTSAASGQAQPVSDPELASAKKNLGRSLSRSQSGRNTYPISDPELVLSRGNTSRNRPSISVSVRNSESSAFPSPSASVPPHEENPGGEVHPERRSSVGSKADFAEQAEQEQQEGEEAPAVSLMALLEQSDSWAGSEKGEEEQEQEEEDVGVEEAEADDDEEGAGDGMLYKCGVCMVRHKGAAFNPCGHTFCRLCSRELGVSRGSCAICTGYILEILDIL